MGGGVTNEQRKMMRYKYSLVYNKLKNEETKKKFFSRNNSSN